MGFLDFWDFWICGSLDIWAPKSAFPRVVGGLAYVYIYIYMSTLYMYVYRYIMHVRMSQPAESAFTGSPELQGARSYKKVFLWDPMLAFPYYPTPHISTHRWLIWAVGGGRQGTFHGIPQKSPPQSNHVQATWEFQRKTWQPYPKGSK